MMSPDFVASNRPVASVSLDLDNLWSYMKTHGEEGWKEYPSYLPVFVPIVLDFLRAHDAEITFFVVGQDVIRPENREPLEMIHAAGHEFGNHSFNHEPWMQDYDASAIAREIGDTHAALVDTLGVEPVGFRGPGFCHSPELIAQLIGMGYSFDASILPSFIGPLARLYYFRSTSLADDEREERGNLFGSVSDALQPLTPFEWEMDSGRILEIPVTTIPMIRSPFHLSYLLWLSRFSETLALAYFDLALALCRLRCVEPSFLLHPLDFLGKEDVSQLAFFPGMDMPRDKKVRLASKVFDRLRAHFEIVSMSRHVQQFNSRIEVPRRISLHRDVSA